MAIVGNIDTKDISIIVKGKAGKNDDYSKKCFDSIRKCFPDSEVIFSTETSDEDLVGLSFDKLVRIKDVGNDILPKSTFRLNVKRQIYSTQEGLKAATKKYTLVVRNDIEFIDINFLKYFDIFTKFDENYRIFSHRIIVPMIQHSYKSDFLFFPSDWLYFGFTDDIKKLFDIPYNTDENNRYLLDHSPANPTRYNYLPEDKRNLHTTQYWSEQYVFVKCLLKNYKGTIDFKDWTDTTDKNRLESEKFLINNFIVCDDGEYLNIKHNKKINYSKENLKLVMSTSYSLKEFYLLYKKYCDKNCRIPLEFLNLKEMFDISNQLKRLKKHYTFFFKPFELLIRWIFSPLKIIIDLISILFQTIKGIIKTIRLIKNK